MEDWKAATSALAHALRMLLDSLGDAVSDDDKRIISGLLRDAGEAIGDQTLASDATSLETDPPEK